MQTVEEVATLEEKKRVYSFDELSDEAKQRALENHAHDLVEYDDWYRYVYEDAKQAGAHLGIFIKQIYFSGFWSQGDGACFDGSYSWETGCCRKIREYAPQDEWLHRIADTLRDIQRPALYVLSATVTHSGHYYHEHCTSIDVTFTDSMDCGCLDGDEAELAGAELAEALRDFMRWIYRRLEDEYDYLTSEETVAEHLRDNGFEFDEDGDDL